MNIYIIVSQHFYVSGSAHYQVADDNPILTVYKSINDARRACDRLVRTVQAETHYIHKTIPSTDGIVAKYGLYDGDICMISFNIVRAIVF